MTFAGRHAGVTRGAKKPPRLFDEIRQRLRVKHYSRRAKRPRRLPVVLTRDEVRVCEIGYEFCI